MNIDEWAEKYRPRSDMTEGQSTGFFLNDKPVCFETYGSDIAVVMKECETSPDKVWTIIEGEEDDEIYVVSGFHHVNRLGYALTELPFEDPSEILELIWD